MKIILKNATAFIFLVLFIFSTSVFAASFDDINGYMKVSEMRSCSKTQAYDQSSYFGYGLKEYVYNSSFNGEGNPIKGDKAHCVYRNEIKHVGWYSYYCVVETGFDWWGLVKKGLVYKKKCSLGCNKSTGFCEAENSAPSGYTLLKDNDKLNGFCSNFGPFDTSEAYPKSEGGDTFYFEPAPGLNHVFCFNEDQGNISVGDKNISILAGSYICDSLNNMYYKSCGSLSSKCAYTGFCGDTADGKIKKITYQNNPYLFLLRKNASCFDVKNKIKDTYKCSVDSNGISWLWYCDGKKVHFMYCPKGMCTSSGCKLNKASDDTESIVLDYSVTAKSFEEEIPIFAKSDSGIAYIAYD
ncbi:MAG: hypothetical protein KAS12_04500, partial [Candidatus Aenigmarchaeota archaeon]|nr:hypothetical protein [Candidatus Aenigmarchaeota archaeon]